jgi:hypothetical protein
MIDQKFQKAVIATVMSAQTAEELRFINQCVKERFASLQLRAAHQFKKGDYVQFKSSKTGVVIAAVVEKINRKTVDVSSITHGKWRVTGGMLTAIKNQAA